MRRRRHTSLAPAPRVLPPLAAVLFCCLTIGCAPALIDLRDCRASGAVEQFLDGSRRPFLASAEARLSIDGERLRSRIDIRWFSDSRFSCTFYDPFSQPAVTIYADSTGVWLDATGDRTSLADGTGNLQAPGFFTDFSLTFGEFIRIISGRLPGSAAEKVGPDSCIKAGPDVRMIWKSDSSSACIVNRAGHIRRVIYRSIGARQWEARYDRFAGSQPHRMKIAASDQDYCIFIFNAIRIAEAGVSAKGESTR